MSRPRESSERATPRPRRRLKHWVSLLVTGLVGLCATLAVYRLLVGREHALLESRFTLDAKERALVVVREFETYVEIVQTLGAFYAGSKTVERDEFHAFTHPAIERHTSLEALVWLPRVSRSQREEHEAFVRKDGLPEYRIRDAGAAGTFREAPPRVEYAPITYLEPSGPRDSRFGLDLRTNSEFSAAFDRAYASGHLTLTGSTYWVPQSGDRPVVAAVLPIYPSEIRMPAGQRPDPECVGFVAGVLPVAEVSEEALRRIARSEINVAVFDCQAEKAPQLLYTHFADAAADAGDSAADEREALEFRHTFALAGRTWEIRCWPRSEYLRAETTWLPLGALLVGLTISTVLAAYVGNVVGRTEHIEETVHLRTQQLREANAALVHEIEHRTQAEEALRHSEEQLKLHAADLERSNADLQQFAYAVSHDLQEPLRAITGYCQLLLRRYGDALDANGKTFLQQSVDGAGRMKLLIEDLLAYSRVGTRDQQLHKLSLETSLKEALENLQVAIAETGAVVTHDRLPELVGDKPQLTQLFQNLLGNAIKFHRPGAAPQVHVTAQRAGNEWRIAVRDNGIGIAPQHFERIFQIFQRLHTREEYPGTGVGLAICKRIVERHHGTMWVESTPGAGSAFCFSLPEGRS